jgi:hypothetical protein
MGLDMVLVDVIDLMLRRGRFPYKELYFIFAHANIFCIVENIRKKFNGGYKISLIRINKNCKS